MDNIDLLIDILTPSWDCGAKAWAEYYSKSYQKEDVLNIYDVFVPGE